MTRQHFARKMTFYLSNCKIVVKADFLRGVIPRLLYQFYLPAIVMTAKKCTSHPAK